MVGHLEVPTIEPQKGLPSSLSRKVVSGLLVNDLGFQGLVFTDALAMKGVSGNESICLQALKAGNDLLLVPRRIKEEVEAVLAAVDVYKRQLLSVVKTDVSADADVTAVWKLIVRLRVWRVLHVSS